MSVLICTPTREKRVNLAYVIGLMQINGAYGGYMPLGGQADIHIARSTLVNKFLQTKHEAMIFIDGDIGFTRNDFLELVASDSPFCSGLYPGKSDTPEFIFRDMEMKVVPYQQVPKAGLLKAGLIPTGFLKIDRCVFEGLIEKELVEPYAKGTFHHFFPSIIVDDYVQSEDYGFCNLVKKAGFTPSVNCGIRLEHDGRKIA